MRMRSADVKLQNGERSIISCPAVLSLNRRKAVISLSATTMASFSLRDESTIRRDAPLFSRSSATSWFLLPRTNTSPGMVSAIRLTRCPPTMANCWRIGR